VGFQRGGGERYLVGGMGKGMRHLLGHVEITPFLWKKKTIREQGRGLQERNVGGGDSWTVVFLKKKGNLGSAQTRPPGKKRDERGASKKEGVRGLQGNQFSS